MALLRYAAKCDPFLSLDCSGSEGKGSNFAIWQHWSVESESDSGAKFMRSLAHNNNAGRKGRGEEMGLDCCWFIQREADFMGFRTRFQADTVQDFGNGSRDSILYSSQLQISHLSSRFLQFPFAPYL